MTNNIKFIANAELLSSMLEYYSGYIVKNTSMYTIARIKLSNTTITIYKTNTVLLQGIGAKDEYIKLQNKFSLPEIDINIEEETTFDFRGKSVIGSDEVGTGDYFGPIIVCAAYTNTDDLDILRNLGVKDSKLLTDRDIIPLALKLTKFLPYSLIMLNPSKINKLCGEQDNFNFIKSYLHNKAILSLKDKLTALNKTYDLILIDEFTPKEKYLKYLSISSLVEKNITTIPHGEKEHLAIAAASIIARACFLREMKKMNDTYNLNFYKGASHEVDKVAISFVKSNGWDKLKNVAKLKFKNTERVHKYFEENPLSEAKLIDF